MPYRGRAASLLHSRKHAGEIDSPAFDSGRAAESLPALGVKFGEGLQEGELRVVHRGRRGSRSAAGSRVRTTRACRRPVHHRLRRRRLSRASTGRSLRRRGRNSVTELRLLLSPLTGHELAQGSLLMGCEEAKALLRHALKADAPERLLQFLLRHGLRGGVHSARSRRLLRLLLLLLLLLWRVVLLLLLVGRRRRRLALLRLPRRRGRRRHESVRSRRRTRWSRLRREGLLRVARRVRRRILLSWLACVRVLPERRSGRGLLTWVAGVLSGDRGGLLSELLLKQTRRRHWLLASRERLHRRALSTTVRARRRSLHMAPEHAVHLHLHLHLLLLVRLHRLHRLHRLLVLRKRGRLLLVMMLAGSCAARAGVLPSAKHSTPAASPSPRPRAELTAPSVERA